jgi:hypothetical protein
VSVQIKSRAGTAGTLEALIHRFWAEIVSSRQELIEPNVWMQELVSSYTTTVIARMDFAEVVLIDFGEFGYK